MVEAAPTKPDDTQTETKRGGIPPRRPAPPGTNNHGPVPSPNKKHPTAFALGVKLGSMIRVLIAVLFAALVWAICVALGLPAIVGLVATILALLVAVGYV